MSDKKEIKTEVEIGEYKGSPVLTIHELDEQGQRTKYPLISFGKRKAKAIIKHIQDLEDFAEG